MLTCRSSSSLAEGQSFHEIPSSEALMFVDAPPRPQVGNAIKSSLHGAALKSNNKEGARSIQVEITPTSSRISRNAVTSLSIRGHRWKRHGETCIRRKKQIEMLGTKLWESLKQKNSSDMHFAFLLGNRMI